MFFIQSAIPAATAQAVRRESIAERRRSWTAARFDLCACAGRKAATRATAGHSRAATLVALRLLARCASGQPPEVLGRLRAGARRRGSLPPLR